MTYGAELHNPVGNISALYLEGHISALYTDCHGSLGFTEFLFLCKGSHMLIISGWSFLARTLKYTMIKIVLIFIREIAYKKNFIINMVNELRRLKKLMKNFVQYIQTFIK